MLIRNGSQYQHLGPDSGYSLRGKIDHGYDLPSHQFFRLVMFRYLGGGGLDAQFTEIDPHHKRGFAGLRIAFGFQNGSRPDINLVKIFKTDLVFHVELELILRDFILD